MEANSPNDLLNLIVTEDLPREIIGRLEDLYPKLAAVVPHAPVPALDLPPLDILMTQVAESSFKVFDNSESYIESHRAKTYASWSGNRDQSVGAAEIYRIFYNKFSKKIYIDLDGTRWNQIRRALREEILFCDILRTLIFVHDCEVAKVEDAVSAGVDEIIEVVTTPVITRILK